MSTEVLKSPDHQPVSFNSKDFELFLGKADEKEKQSEALKASTVELLDTLNTLECYSSEESNAEFDYLQSAYIMLSESVSASVDIAVSTEHDELSGTQDWLLAADHLEVSYFKHKQDEDGNFTGDVDKITKIEVSLNSMNIAKYEDGSVIDGKDLIFLTTTIDKATEELRK
jgi:hypothetical protein